MIDNLELASFENSNRSTLFCGGAFVYMNYTVQRSNDSEGFKKLLGERLRTFRREAGISQRGLAQMLEISHQQIQKYERGENSLPLERVKAVADALGVAPTVLAFPEIDGLANAPAAHLSRERLELLRLYDAMPDKECRKRLLDLLRIFGELVNRLA